MEPRRVEGVSAQTEAQWKTLRLVSFALPEVVPLLIFVGWYLRRQGEETGTASTVGVLTLVFGAVALIAVLVAPVLISKALPRAVQPPAASGLTREAYAAARVMTLFIARYAVNEVPVLLGFVLFFMGASPYVFAAFTLLTLAGYAVYFPRREQWDAALASALEPGPVEIPLPT